MSDRDPSDDPSSSRSAERDRPPDGISQEHQEPLPGWRRHASPLSLLIFAAVVVVGMSGWLGRERDWYATADGTRLAVHAPEIIRNGEFLEMRIVLTDEAAIAEPVIGVEASLWEDVTVNTMLPAPVDEESRDGELRFTFPALEAGTELFVKIDMQINPDIVFGNEGTLTVYDGEAALVATDLSMIVLP